MLYTAGQAGIPENETTWADILAKHGYRTAAIGELIHLKIQMLVEGLSCKIYHQLYHLQL